jgi:hypothetical protein
MYLYLLYIDINIDLYIIYILLSLNFESTLSGALSTTRPAVGKGVVGIVISFAPIAGARARARARASSI